MSRFRYAIALVAACLAMPAAAQTVTVTGPNTVNADGKPTAVNKTFIVNPDGTIATVSGGSSGVAQGSTTAGQSGPLDQCTVVSVDTAYTVGTTNPCTMTATGRVRVGLSSATGLVPATTTVANADMAACVYRTPVTWTLGYTGGVQCDVNGNLSTVAQGFQARGAAITANPLLVGCRASTSIPTAVSAGSNVDFWCGTAGQSVVGAATSVAGADGTGNATAGQLLRYDTASGVYLVTYASVFNGATWDRQRGDTGGTVSQPYAMTGSRWQYAAVSGGIVNTTTAVTLAPAAGGVLRNYVTGLQCTTASLGAATELAIRDGAAGTVIWRALVPSVGWGNGGATFSFNVPLKGTANTLVEIVTLTAVTGGVYCNAQGYTGS